MKTIIKILSAVAVLSMAASCDLNLTPKGYKIYTEGQELFTNESELESYEANILASFRSIDYGVYDIVPDVMVDYFNATDYYGNNYGGVHKTDDSFTAGDYDIEDNYEGPYTAIKNFNVFIEGAQVVPEGLEEDAAVVRGEAYLGRAFAYMHLARHFGKAYSSATALTDLCVPLVTVYNQSEKPARATVGEVYGQIKKDLDSAAVLLKGVPGEARAQKPTIDAVNAMYARYYLDIKDYEKAAEYALTVINTGNYAVSSTAAEMAAEWINDAGTEPILQFYASLTEGARTHTAYTNTDKYSNVYYYYSYFIPTKKLVESYEDDDLRYAQWFDKRKNYCYYRLLYALYGYNIPNYVTFTKYYGNPELYSGTPSSAQAVKPLLISEMYLIAAEALLESGDVAGATEQLNVLQTRRGATATAATMETIRNEWYRETVGEGLYFSCLKRWGVGFSGREPQDYVFSVVMEGGSFTGKSMAADDYHFCWPIPTYEMQVNPNLVQNEGYGTSE